MNRYQITNACHKIHGYYMPKYNDTLETAFNKAKQETIEQLKKDLADVENITSEIFMSEIFNKVYE